MFPFNHLSLGPFREGYLTVHPTTTPALHDHSSHTSKTVLMYLQCWGGGQEDCQVSFPKWPMEQMVKGWCMCTCIMVYTYLQDGVGISARCCTCTCKTGYLYLQDGMHIPAQWCTCTYSTMYVYLHDSVCIPV